VTNCDQSDQLTTILYEQGGLVLENPPDGAESLLPELVYDKRTRQYRAPAHLYRDLVMALRDSDSPDFLDQARAYENCPCPVQTSMSLRPHQKEAISAWIDAGQRGVVSLPTGAGKTILAIFAMEKVGRSTLIVVPTIDLMQQWAAVLNTHLKQTAGMLGGGYRDLKPITVATYDSARLLSEQTGNRFGFIIFDECHHLPAAGYQSIAYNSLAPFRLGLSATVERSDGGEEVLFDLVGPLCYQGAIGDMVREVLAPYDVVSIGVQLNSEERQRYDAARKVYTDFVRRQGIDFRRPDGWKQFIMRAARSAKGRMAFKGYREQKKLAQAAEGKLDEIWKILNLHSGEPTIIFTEDNNMAYKIGRNFLLAVLTHKTKAKERKVLLSKFREGELKVLVTSKVLNEGVDVPEARVGVVVSGSGTVREHVQRLGRILRHCPGKRAVLYEIVSENTSEQYVNKRRRQHDAYQRSSEI